MRLLLLALTLPHLLNAQISNATLSGVITDPSNAAVPAVSVTATHTATSREFKTESSESGRYVFLTLPVGRYEISVQASGFKSLKRTAELTVNQAGNLNLTLEIGQVSEVVDVTAQAPLVNATNATVGTVIEQRAIFDLPLNGRNFTQLIALTPGVSTIDTSQSGAGPSIQGQRNRDNSYVADGVSISRLSFGNVVLNPPVDAIQEFRVQSVNSDAELGGGSGGFINLVTKSGTAKLHGTAYDYLRNNKLDARNTFQPSIPAFRQNQFGFSVGGPVYIPKLYPQKNRTWFFVSYEGFRRRQAASGLGRVATEAQRNGDFTGQPVLYDPVSTRVNPDTPGRFLRDAFPGNRIPANRINPTAALYTKDLMPLPNYSLPGNVNNFLNTAPSRNDTGTILARMDHTLNANNRLSARWLQANNDTGSALPVLNNPVSGSFSEPRNLSTEWTSTITPASLLTVRYGYARTYQVSASARMADFYRASGWDNANGFPLNDPAIPLSPAISITAYSNYVGQNYQPEEVKSHNVTADFQHIRGRHTFKAGYAYNFFNSFTGGINPTLSFNPAQTQNLATPAGSGDGFASFLLGVPNAAGRAIGNPLIDVDGAFDGIYLQDTIRFNAKLSVTLGVRWDFARAFQTDGVLGSFDPRGGGWLLTAPVNIPNVAFQGPNVRQGIFDPDWNNFGPRLGMAYSVTRRTIMRAGYTMSYDLVAGRWQWVQGPRVSWPRSEFQSTPPLNVDIANRTLQSPFVGMATTLARPNPLFDNGAPVYPTGSHINPHYPIPYVHQWNFALEQQFTDTLVVSGTYVGSAGRILECCGVINQSFQNVAGAYATKPRPFPLMGAFRTNRNDGRSDYHSLQLKAEQRFSKGLAFLFSYTWSKATDLACSGYIGAEGCHITQPYFPEPFKYGMDGGLADFDLTHIFSSSFIYELPIGRGKRLNIDNSVLQHIAGGWQISGIVNTRSGQALTPALSNAAQTNVGGGVQPRPDLIGNIAAATPNRQQWFNTAAFALPSGFNYGTAGKNILRGPSSHNEDLSLFKNFQLAGEALRLQFRADMFNAFNATRLANPNTTHGIAQFGQISGAGAGRVVQMALKLIF
ncbi:MAG: carboxypeptidase regulatory-like domain-containing protein [Bryobacteraceae bacterium]